jgi:acetylornithine deacetylase
LQGGIGTVKAIEDGVRADYFINSEPTDLQALTMHSGAFVFAIELTGITRHMSNRNEAVDAIVAACELVPTINAISFSGALNKEHESVNRANIGVIRGALSPEFHDWRAPQVADFVRLLGSARYAPSQSEESVLEDLRSALDDLETRYPGLKTKVFKHQAEEKPSMLPFEVSRESRIVKTLNKSYKLVRGESQPTGPIPPACFFGTDAAHFQHRLGMEGIVCGPGGRYNTMPDERVDIPDYLDMIKIYMLAILEICEVV